MFNEEERKSESDDAQFYHGVSMYMEPQTGIYKK